MNEDSPEPIESDGPDIWDLVVKDMLERNSIGILRYGHALQPFNGRKPLIEAYQECLDLVVYLRQAIYELEGK